MQKIFKNGKQVYVLNDDNNYVQMTNSMSDNIVYPRYGIYFLKRDKIYATLIMQNETDIPYQNIIDEFVKRTNCGGILANCAASGTKVIVD